MIPIVTDAAPAERILSLIGELPPPPRIAFADGPPARDDLLEPLPDRDALAQPTPEFEFDQRTSR
jgi:hypothetical protein